MRSQLFAALALVFALPIAVGAQDRCDVRRDVDRQIDAAGLDGVLIEAAAGSLEVVGADVDRVRVRGVLCASDEAIAADARLILERRQGAAWIEADLPESRWRDYVRMDLTVEMPRSLATDIRDGSGEIVVRSVAAVRIDDGSGEMDIRDVPGSVIVDDGSGGIRIERVGSVEVDDGSGGIEIYDVAGSVLVVEDGSGTIEIRDVTGDVRIQEDGSGSIVVVGVGGDFVLEDDGSGSVDYRDIQGRVSVPDEGR
ncbi:MAG: hypothetical protein R6U63_10765 [Longimicrobiales bacterium]